MYRKYGSKYSSHRPGCTENAVANTNKYWQGKIQQKRGRLSYYCTSNHLPPPPTKVQKNTKTNTNTFKYSHIKKKIQSDRRRLRLSYCTSSSILVPPSRTKIQKNRSTNTNTFKYSQIKKKLDWHTNVLISDWTTKKTRTNCPRTVCEIEPWSLKKWCDKFSRHFRPFL